MACCDHFWSIHRRFSSRTFLICLTTLVALAVADLLYYNMRHEVSWRVQALISAPSTEAANHNVRAVTTPPPPLTPPPLTPLPPLTDKQKLMVGRDLDQTELLRRVNKLSFKVKPPSPLLLEDLYFSPVRAVLEHYNNSVLLEPRSGCVGVHPVHIIVPSHPRDTRLRNAIRETWGRVSRGHPWPGKPLSLPVKLTFVLGVDGAQPANSSNLQGSKGSEDPKTQNGSTARAKTEGVQVNHRTKRSGDVETANKATQRPLSVLKSNATNRASLAEENIAQSSHAYLKDARESAFNDILQFDMIDSYANLTRKILLALQWVVSSCEDAQYIVKVDQDIFLNVPLLTAFLKHHGKEHAVYGYIYSGGAVVRTGRWAVTKTAVPVPRYPVYASGTAYVVSRRAAMTVLKLSPHFPYVPVEDAFITGVLASVGSVDRFHVAGFTHWAEGSPHPCDFVDDKRYVGNGMTEARHRKVWWEQLEGRTRKC